VVPFYGLSIGIIVSFVYWFGLLLLFKYLYNKKIRERERVPPPLSLNTFGIKGRVPLSLGHYKKKIRPRYDEDTPLLILL
jgi:hypothetical protein